MRSRADGDRPGSALLAALVAAATAAAFAPALLNGILKWDDHLFAGEEAHLGWGWDGLHGAFAELHLGQFVPLPWLSLVLDRRIWGSFDGGYHLTSLLWHVAAGLLWFGFWRRLLTRTGSAVRADDASLAAAAAALLFCLHPLRVESVAWIAERRDMLCGFFYAAALRLYLESCLAPGRAGRWRAAALACFGLSLLSKAASVTLPATLIVLDVYPLRRLPADPRLWLARPARGVLLEKAPFVLLSAVFTLATLATLRVTGMVDGLATLDFAQRLSCASYSVLFYVRKEFWPFPMLPFYPLPRPFDPASPRFLGWSAAAAAAVFAVRRLSRGRPALGAAAAHYAAALVPVSGLIGGGLPHLGTDRFSYFPSLAFSGLAAAGTLRVLSQPRRRAPALAAAAVVLAGLGAATWRRCLDWRDDVTLWSATLAVDPDNREAHIDIAAALSAQGRFAEAARHAETAVRLDPDSSYAWNNLGAARLNLEQWPEAEAAYERAVPLKPADADVRRGWGLALAGLGREKAGLTQFQTAVRLAPRNAVAQYDLGSALMRAGRMDSAADALAEATRLDPTLSPAYVNLGRVLERQGLTDAAVEEYRAAVRLGGGTVALYNWANVESARGRDEVAVRLYRETLRLDPDFFDARFNWGNALARLGRFRDAADQYRLVLARRPGNARAADYLRRVTASAARR